MEVPAAHSTLFIVAHPYLEKSRANRAVAEAVGHVPNLTLRRLYDLYPYFQIDVAHEQALLKAHDLVVIQHPFYWYSMPPLLKLWLDEVLECGWAYGPGGNHLQGKQFLLSITAGGSMEAYHPDGRNRFSMEALLSPWNQTAHLCGMQWRDPRVLHGSIHAPAQLLRDHAERLRADLQHFAVSGELT